MCVHKSLVCDGYEHCLDGSDEDVDFCKDCSRTEGFPLNEFDTSIYNDGQGLLTKNHEAIFPCQHRYTGKWICAVPCDQKDDLCLDESDESSCSLDWTLTLLVYLIFIFLVLAPILFCTEKFMTNRDIGEEQELNSLDPSPLQVIITISC